MAPVIAQSPRCCRSLLSMEARAKARRPRARPGPGAPRSRPACRDRPASRDRASALPPEGDALGLGLAAGGVGGIVGIADAPGEFEQAQGIRSEERRVGKERIWRV